MKISKEYKIALTIFVITFIVFFTIFSNLDAIKKCLF